MNEKLVHMHGGDLDAIERKYGIPKNEIIDFSGNINPSWLSRKRKKRACRQFKHNIKVSR